MAFNNSITPGSPPLLWSNIHDAFTKINENFDILVATVGDGSGLTPINFETLDTGVKPTTDNLYNLGDITHRWKGIYAGPYSDADPANGVWLGSSQIKGYDGIVELPSGSKVNGDLIIDPAKTFFKEIQVDNNLAVVATTFGDSVNLLSGSGISMTVSSGADSIEIDNTGILSVSAGSGMSVATVSGTATVTNSGVRSLTSVTALPSGRTAGAGINIDNSTGDGIKITNTGVISISNGVGITISTDAATGDVTVTNSAPAVNAFTQIQVDGDTVNRLQADAVSDVLNIDSGAGITLSKIVATDTLTISVNPVFDLKGSVFGDDSSILVDAVSNYIYGNVSATTLRTIETEISIGFNAGSSPGGNTVSIGYGAGQTGQGVEAVSVGVVAGQTSQGSYAVAVGSNAGSSDQGNYAVAIGSEAGQIQQGLYAVAIGRKAGETTQPAGSIVINASGGALNGSAAGFYVDPIRSTTSSARPVVYDSGTKELFYTSTLEFINSTISTSDSSGLIVDVQTTFNTDVRAENDLTVVQTLTANSIVTSNIPGFVSVALLKSVVAASTDFANFQARIAALV